MTQALSGRPDFPPFQGLSWDYFLDDVQMEARAARIKMRDLTVGSICDTIDALPATAVVRLLAARFVYFSPFGPENEDHADYLLEPLDAVTKSRCGSGDTPFMQSRTSRTGRKRPGKQRRRKTPRWNRSTGSAHTSRSARSLKTSSAGSKFRHPIPGMSLSKTGIITVAIETDAIEWMFDQPNCDLGTAAQFFFTAAIGLADEDPEQLSPGYRRKWQLMKHVAENWQRGSIFAMN